MLLEIYLWGLLVAFIPMVFLHKLINDDVMLFDIPMIIVMNFFWPLFASLISLGIVAFPFIVSGCWINDWLKKIPNKKIF